MGQRGDAAQILQSETGDRSGGQERDNRGGDEYSGGKRRWEEAISPLTESSRRREEPRRGEMDGSVTDRIELETVPLCRLWIHVMISQHKQSTVCTYFSMLQMQQSAKRQKTVNENFTP